MTGRSMRDRWYSEVIRSRLVNGACRELLSLLAVRHMSDTGIVSVPRAVLADELGISQQRVSNRILEATTAGLLERCGGGHNGASTRYRALLPAVKVPAEREPTEAVKVPAEREPWSEVAYGQAGTFTAPEGSRRAVSIRARAPLQTPVTTGASEGDGAPPADGVRGTQPPPRTAAATTAEGDGQDESGDYLAGRTRQPTQVEQGNHRPHARGINGSRIR